jgi:hypothetical protein
MLVLLGLFVFYRVYVLVAGVNHYILEGAALTIAGVIIFRGGIQLLKISVAAQACLEANREHQAERGA